LKHPFLLLATTELEAGLNAAENIVSHVFTNIEIRRRLRFQ